MDDTANEQRGLLFLAYQADIGRQFEHVWTRWLQNADFPMPRSGNDPIVGGAAGGALSRRIRLPLNDQRGGCIEYRVRQFVFPRYACYFFAPSVEALQQLGGATMSFEDGLTVIAREVGKWLDDAAARPAPPANGTQGSIPMTTTAYNGTSISSPTTQDVNDLAPIGAQLTAALLGQIINSENPYTQQPLSVRDQIEMTGPAVTSPGGVYTMAEITLRGPKTDPREYWLFEGEKNAITKAIRIKYSYTDSGGVMHNAELLVGYNGPPVP